MQHRGGIGRRDARWKFKDDRNVHVRTRSTFSLKTNLGIFLSHTNKKYGIGKRREKGEKKRRKEKEMTSDAIERAKPESISRRIN
jgi:hypothetical protein